MIRVLSGRILYLVTSAGIGLDRFILQDLFNAGSIIALATRMHVVGFICLRVSASYLYSE